MQLKHPVQYRETNRQDTLPVLESCSERHDKTTWDNLKAAVKFFSNFYEILVPKLTGTAQVFFHIAVIGPKNSRHFFNQSDPKWKPTAILLPALQAVCLFYVSSHWLLLKLSFLLIGYCDYFSSGSTLVNRNALYMVLINTYGKFNWQIKAKLFSKW